MRMLDRTKPAPRVAIFTSVAPDGRLLPRLVRAGIPVVPVTVMTLQEALPLFDEIPAIEVMIIEAGGAIARRDGGSWPVEACGPAADTLLGVIATIEERSGASLVVHSVLPGSMSRSFSEPFSIEAGDPAKVTRAAESIGFSVRKGPRSFFHLLRTRDEGAAFEQVKQELACDVAIGIGTAPVDAGFLRRAEFPIVLEGPEGPDPELVRLVPNARIAADGWSAAVALAFEPHVSPIPSAPRRPGVPRRRQANRGRRPG